MKYISTRGGSAPINFIDVLTSGLAPDGGLYMPETFPVFTLSEIKSWKELKYTDLVYKIVAPFITDEIPEKNLRNIIEESYSEFRHSDIAPIKKLGDGHYLLELFHGPTLAFKDFALQLLGRLLDYALTKNKKNVVIIGATSGDTGSAAIEGCKHSKRVKIFMLHPYGKVSDVQRKQMTTVLDKNVFNIALKGTFDDCQETVKAMFNDKAFAKGKNLVAVNSINWVRIMAQIVYYFYSYLKLGAPNSISFSVPTGNFGDVFAGYVAYKMGLPISKLMVATNSNDILHRFFQSNDYSKAAVSPTLSPSMDIQISSNFERLLFDLHNNDGKKVAELMDNFKLNGSLKVPMEILRKAKKIFASHRVDINGTVKSISYTFKETGEIVDPHTAIGIAAAEKLEYSEEHPVVTLATAHPAKFPDALIKAGVPSSDTPEVLNKIFSSKEKMQIIDNSYSDVSSYITKLA